MGDDDAWAIESPPNPTILRVHLRERLTDRTILSCPPGIPPPPFDQLLALDGVRSIEVHPYRLRVNLTADAVRGTVASRAAAGLEAMRGPAARLEEEPLPRAFAHPYSGARRVAESPEMARSTGVSVMVGLFDVLGVSEVVIGPGVVLVRIGRLFAWAAVEPGVSAAVAQDPWGTPGIGVSPSG